MVFGDFRRMLDGVHCTSTRKAEQEDRNKWFVAGLSRLEFASYTANTH